MTRKAENDAAKHEPTASRVVEALRRRDFDLALEMGYLVGREAISAEAHRLIDGGEHLYAVLLTFCHPDGKLVSEVCAEVDPRCEAEASEVWLQGVDPHAFADLRPIFLAT